MTWKPSAYMDEQVREWMKQKGWEVTSAEYDFDREVYAWWHEVRTIPNPADLPAGAGGLPGLQERLQV